MNRQQLELSFDANRNFRPVVRRQRRLSRARWWFDQMHSVVDRAMDWQASTTRQAAQISLSPTRQG